MNMAQKLAEGAVGEKVAYASCTDRLKVKMALVAAKIGGGVSAEKLLPVIDPKAEPWKSFAKLIGQRNIYKYKFEDAFRSADAPMFEVTIGAAMIAVDGLNGRLPVSKVEGKDAIGRKFVSPNSDDVRKYLFGIIEEGYTTTAAICARTGYSHDHVRKKLKEWEGKGLVRHTIDANSQAHIWSLK